MVKDEERTEEEEEDEEQVGGMTSAESDYSDEEVEEEDQREVKERKRKGKLEWDSTSMKYWQVTGRYCTNTLYKSSTHTRARTHNVWGNYWKVNKIIIRIFLVKHFPLLDKYRSTNSVAVPENGKRVKIIHIQLKFIIINWVNIM